jgi:hypothetical protein
MTFRPVKRWLPKFALGLNLAALSLAIFMGISTHSATEAQAATKIGPFVGLRIPIYDNIIANQKNPYRYFKPNAAQFQIDPDPAGTSDGFWSLKTPPRNVILTRDANGNYPFPSNLRGNLAVYRNGIRQAPGIDYNIWPDIANVVVPVPAFPWESDANVLVDGE